eukprot:UN06558
MIEGIFASWRSEGTEDCPAWIFSCNDQGEAELEVYEILCPLDIFVDTDLNQLISEVNAGVSSLTTDQVEIFGDYIRVLMYSEDEAMSAIDWLSLNETDTTPDEIVGAGCDMTPTKWNLNEIYGDYIANTPAPTDGATVINCNFIISMMSVVIILVFLC